MKDFISITSLLLAGLVSTSADDIVLPILQACPHQDSLNATVFLKHESNCSKFYICLNGEKIERICPLMDKEGNRLHFNPSLQICDWPESSKCESSIKSPLSKAVDENSVQDKIEVTKEAWKNPDTCIGSCPDRDPDDRAVHLQNKDCTKYCICSDGRATVNVCPPGLHFSLAKQVCTWPGDANCVDEKNVEQDQNEEDDENNDEDESENEDGDKNEETDQVQFYNSESLKKESVQETTSSWMHPITCQGRCPARDPEDYSILLQNDDCNKFCMCSNGRKIVQSCDPGLHFSLKNQTCTWPADAQCPQLINYEYKSMHDWLLQPRN